MRSPERRRLLAVFESDSFVKIARHSATAFIANGYDVEYHWIKARDNSSIEHMLAAGMGESFKSDSLESSALSPELLKFDAVHVSLPGADLRRFMGLVRQSIRKHQPERRPIFFSGYAGIVYEKHCQGYLDRQCLDVICVNSPHDLDIFSDIASGLAVPANNLCLTGLSILDEPWEKGQSSIARTKGVVFAGQPTVPRFRGERLKIVRHLINLARAAPDTQVIIKPRHRIEERTLHKVLYPYEHLLRSVSTGNKLPSNLSLSYEPIQALFEKHETCLTVSSTAAFEALAYGMKVGILADAGVREELGNHFFAASGAMITIEQLRKGIVPEFRQDWLDRHFLCDGRSSRRIFEFVNTLVSRQRDTANLPLPAWTLEDLSLNQLPSIPPHTTTLRPTLRGRFFSPLRQSLRVIFRALLISPTIERWLRRIYQEARE